MKNVFKRLLAGSITLAMLLALAACGGGSSSSSSGAQGSTPVDNTQESAPDTAPESDVTLRIAWWGSQTRHDATLEVLELYTQQTGVEFEAEFFSFDDYFTKLNTLVASNDVYDIYQLGGNFPTYIEQLEPLNDMIDSGVLDVSDIDNSFLMTNAMDGNIYGVTLGTTSLAIAYDPAMFAEAGVEEPGDIWTWEEFEAAALKIHEELGVYGSSKLSDFIAGATSVTFDGENSFYNPENTGLGYEDGSPIINYLAMKQRLVDAGAYPDPGVIAEISDIEGDLIVTGEAAMTWVSSNQFVSLSGAAGRELKLATIPVHNESDPPSTAVQSSQMFGIFSGSQHKEEAAKFISFFVNDADANMILMGERGVPAANAVRAAMEGSLDDATRTVYNYMDVVAGLGDIFTRTDPTQSPEIEDLFLRLQDQVIFGQITPEQAEEQLRAGATDIFERTA